MRRILYISNYKRGVGGISAQVDLLHQFLNEPLSLNEPLRSMSRDKTQNDAYKADIFSTQGNPIKRVWLFFKLLFVAQRYDALHVHGCSEWGMLPVVYGIIAGKIWRKRIIVTYHGGEAAEYFAKHGAFARRWLNRADKVIVLSGFLKKVFDAYQIPCIVLPNIVPLREDIYQPKKSIAPMLISVRHLTDLYRIDLIIRAFAKVVDKYPEATLDILGQGDKREALERLAYDLIENKNKENIEENTENKLTKNDESQVTCSNSNSIDPQYAQKQAFGQPNAQYCSDTDKSYPLDSSEKNPSLHDSQKMPKNNSSSKVRFIGQVPNEKMYDYLKANDIMLSVPKIDNMPVSLMEAMNAGVLVISSNVGGVPYMIEHQQTGLLFDGDVDALAEQILWALEHQKESVAMIEAAHEEVKKYSWNNIRKQLLPLYE